MTIRSTNLTRRPPSWKPPRRKARRTPSNRRQSTPMRLPRSRPTRRWEAPVEEAAVAGAPSVADLEQALAAAAAVAPPTLVGHYSAGGANYKIFSDGSIEAETAGGAFRFASMDDFKSYLASERA